MRRDGGKTQGRVRGWGGVFKGCFFRVRFRIKVRVRVNPNPKTAFLSKKTIKKIDPGLGQDPAFY